MKIHGIFRALRLPLTALAGAALMACSSLESKLPTNQPDYKQTIPLNVLEVPPDLTSSTIDDSLVVPELGPAGTATYSDYSGERAAGSVQASQTLLAEPEEVRVRRDGQIRWLEVAQPPEEVWKLIKRFWEDNGFLLTREDPRTGVMETEWAENRADIPQGPVRSVLGKALGFAYSAPTRDKFRVRIDVAPDSPDTEVYLTHYGAREVQQGEYNVLWEPRPRDPELEAEMLRRLMVFIGISDERAESLLADRRGPAGERAEVRTSPEGHPYLTVSEALSRSWRLVGIGLDDANFLVDDSDASLYTYTVRYRDPLADQNEEGVLSSLAFWRSKPDETPYQVRLASIDRLTTSVTVHDEDGDPSQSETARAILSALQERLR